MRILLACLLLLPLLCTVFSAVPAEAADPLVIKVGIYENKPKIFTDTSGNPSGFWPELLNIIAKEESWKIEYVDGTWEESLARLERGEIDIMPDVAWTEERTARFTLTEEVVVVSWSRIFTRKGVDIDSILDLEGKTIAVMSGSINVEGPEGIKALIDAFNLTSALLEVTDYGKAFELVASGTADAAVASRDFAHLHIEDYGLIETPILFQPAQIHFALNKGASLTPYLADTIDTLLREMKTEHQSPYYAALEQWLGVAAQEREILPPWLIGVLAGIAGLVTVLIGGSLLLRNQVNRRTRQLTAEIAEREKAQQETAELHRLLSETQSISKLGGWEYDTVADKIEWTDEVYDIYGVDKNYDINNINSNIGFYAPGDDTVIKNAFDLAVAEGKPYDLELKFIRTDGREIWVRTIGRAEKDGDKVVRVVGNIMDITDQKEAEKELREQEEFTRTLVANVPLGLAVYTASDGKTVYINKRFAEIYGWPKEKLTDTESFFRHVYPDPGYRREIEAMVTSDINSGDVSRMDWNNIAITTSTGETRFVHARNIPVPEQGLMIATVQDVTARKHAEEILRESEQRYRILFESASVGIVIHDKDTGKIITANHRALEMHGSGTFEEMEDVIFNPSPPHATGDALNWIHKAAHEGSQRFEWQYRTKNGKLLWEDVLLEVHIISGIERVVATDVDITQRKQAETALQESELRFRLLFDNSLDAILLTAPDGKVLAANPAACRMFRRTEEEITSLGRYGLVDTDDPRLAAALEERLRTGQYQGELNFKRADGTVFPVEGSSRLFTLPNGEQRSVMVLHDITERTLAEQALAASELKFRNLYESMNEGVCLHELVYNEAGSISDYRILDVNNSYERILHLKQEDVIGKTSVELYGSGDPPYLVSYARVALTGKPYSFETYFEPLDKFFHISVFSPGLNQFATVFSDISERKRSEEALRQSEENYRRSMDESPLGIRIVSPSGKTVYTNQAMLDIYGYDTLDEFNSIPTRDRYTTKSYAEHIFRKGKRLRGELVPENYEISIKRKNGSIRHLEVFRKEVLWNNQVQTQATYIDITEQKLSEIALDNEASRRRVLMEQSRDGIVILRDDGSVYEANSRFAETLGYSPAEVLHLHIWDWDGNWSVKELKEMLRNVDEQGDFFETRHRRKDGSFFDVAIATNGAVFEGQKLIYCICRDITKRKQAEDTLRESEEKFSRSFHASPSAITISRLSDNVFIDVNDTYTLLTGFSRDEVIGSTALELGVLLNEEQRQTLKVITENREKLSGREFEFHTKEGLTRTCLVSTEYITVAGEPCLLMQLNDITEVKKSLDAIRESEEKFSHAFQASPSIMSITTDRGEYIDVNEAFTRITGYTREEAIGQTVHGLDVWASIEQREQAAKVFAEKGRVAELEYELRTKSGDRRTMIFSMEPMTLGGKPYRLAVSTDITERKRIERALRVSDTAFRSLHDAVIVMDNDWNVVEWNHLSEEMFGIKEKDAIGKFIGDLMDMQEEYPGQNGERIKLLTERGWNREEQRYQTPRGEIWVDVHSQAVQDSKGNRQGWVTLAVDITERKQMEERMLITDRLVSIGELASGIAHELNNPLTGIIGLSELLLDADVPEDVKTDLAMIHREAERTSKVARNLLSFARKHPLKREKMQVNDAIKSVLELRDYELRVNNIEVVTDFAADLPETMADTFQLQQVFLNIIINAEYFMKEAHGRGTLTITTRIDKNMIKATFTDDGPGIPKESLKQIFNPFFTSKEVGKGTGLGLSICHGIVTEHGGRISAESEPGSGATFIVELPITDE